MIADLSVPSPDIITVHKQYMNQRTLVLIAQIFVIILSFVKYFAPMKLRSTQQKLVSFLYVVAAIELYRMREVRPFYGPYILRWFMIISSAFLSFFHSFRLSSIFNRP